MARRRKRIVDVVRDATFLARKDEHLLGGPDPLPWGRLERLRRAYRSAGTDADRRELALELERGLRVHPPSYFLGELQAELRRLGPAGSFEQLERFARRYFRHYAGAHAGKPFVFAPFQRDFLQEFMRRDRRGRRVYQVGVWMIPKGSGKTPTAAVLGTHTLACETDAPEVYNIAGAKDQAAMCFDFARANIEDGALAAWLEVSNSVIRAPDHRGEYDILSSDGDLAAGVKPSAAIVDEWWLFMHRKQREAYNSQAKALHKRPNAWLLAISTAGYDKQTQLGETYDGALKHPALEVRENGSLLVLRDEESGFLFWCYQAPDGADIENPEVIRACNPAPWVSPRDLLKELHRPDTDELDWRRLHLNQWTKVKDAWLPAGTWSRLRSDSEIPRGADIWVAVDGGLKYDTTAVAWAARLEDGRIKLGARVWSCRDDAPHHVFVPGGRIDNTLAEDFIVHGLGDRYRVREVVADERFLNEVLVRLAGRGIPTAEFPQNSSLMADAYQHFYAAATAGEIVWHDPDDVLPAHVDAAAAVATERGWKVFKLKGWQPIDALVASVMARARAAAAELETPWVIR